MPLPLIDSCDECEFNCCITPPGPKKRVSMERYLYHPTHNAGEYCEHLTDDHRCAIWNTPKFPKICRMFICKVKRFTDEEVASIQMIVYDGTPCPGCGVEWYLKVLSPEGNKRECELCGAEWIHEHT